MIRGSMPAQGASVRTPLCWRSRHPEPSLGAGRSLNRDTTLTEPLHGQRLGVHDAHRQVPRRGDRPRPSTIASVYHYTTWSAVEGILLSQEFWATAHTCTNDPAELVSADDTILAVVAEL